MKIIIVGLAIAFAALDNLQLQEKIILAFLRLIIQNEIKQICLNCIDVEVSENQKLFDAKGFFVGTNNINDLRSVERISLDYNLIEIESNFTLLPQNIQLISIIYNEYVESQVDELCSLFYNPSVQAYFIECIEGITKYNYVNINMEQKTQIRIPSASGAICKQASSDYQVIYVLCQQSEIYQIINLDKKSGMLIQKYDLNITLNQVNQCSLKYNNNEDKYNYLLYKTIENEFVIGLFCCEDWEIFKLSFNGEKQLILNEQHSIFQRYLYVPTKYLLNFQFEYSLFEQIAEQKMFYCMRKSICYFKMESIKQLFLTFTRLIVIQYLRKNFKKVMFVLIQQINSIIWIQLRLFNSLNSNKSLIIIHRYINQNKVTFYYFMKPSLYQYSQNGYNFLYRIHFIIRQQMQSQNMLFL